MNINDYYFGKCKDDKWYNNYYQCGDNSDGSIFKCFSTNYRDLFSFEYYFKEFKKYIGIPRKEWNKKETTGQEVAKQYVANMVNSFLYLSKRDENNELIYELSSRGKDFERMINNDFTDNEKKLLLFIYLMNSSFKMTPRYLLKKGWNVWDCWEKVGFDENIILKDIENFINNEIENKNVSEIFNYDITWYISFYTDLSFLKLYKIATKEEKYKLHIETIADYKARKEENVIAWKYKSTNFQKPMLLDTLMIVYLSKIINFCKINDTSYIEFYEELINSYSKLYIIDKKKIKDYIFANDNVFKVIFNNAISEEDDFTERYIPVYRKENVKEIDSLLNEKIDSTSQEGVKKLEVVRSVLKKLAKEKTNYQCIFHDLNNCKYFTSKEENKNYLEIHHLVPREFSYNFEDTIEFVENYIPLCPRCHRMIHKAVDRERIVLINYLFNIRHKDLEEHGIDVTIKELYEFYKIDQNTDH